MVTVSDEERYAYALQGGFSGYDAIIATALSIAENGAGSTTARSGMNQNGTYDFGLWQINSNWFGTFGGESVLSDPVNSARAAFSIFQRQGWNAWCTYWPTGCNSANARNPRVQQTWTQALARAQRVADSGIVAPIPAPGTSQEPTPTDTETPVTANPSLGAASSGLDLNFSGTVQHSIVQILLVLIGVALLLGGIYLIGGRSS